MITIRKLKLWTKEEEEILIQYYSTSTAKEIRKKLPNRSLRGINGKARRMGLHKTEEAIRRTGLQNQQEGYIDEFKHITEELLRKLYLEERKSTRDIGNELRCSHHVILRRLKRYNIPIRNCPSEYTSEERKEKYGRRGEDHHLWKGGITDISNVIRNRLNHVTFERFKMDGFNCVECGGGEHNLNAHHIKPFSEIVSEIREENGLHDLSTWKAKDKLADLCEKDDRLLDLDNLITLCGDCHKKVHSGELILTLQDEKEAIA